MGSSYTNTRDPARVAAAIKGVVTQKRNKLAGKITTVIIDRIVNEIIRPGPKPEERECYEMANELRAITEDISKLVADVLKVAEEEGV